MHLTECIDLGCFCTAHVVKSYLACCLIQGLIKQYRVLWEYRSSAVISIKKCPKKSLLANCEWMENDDSKLHLGICLAFFWGAASWTMMVKRWKENLLSASEYHIHIHCLTVFLLSGWMFMRSAKAIKDTFNWGSCCISCLFSFSLVTLPSIGRFLFFAACHILVRSTAI